MAKESIYFELSGIDGKHGVKELKRELDAALHGIISVSVNEEKNTLAVDFDNSGAKCGQISKKVEELGYKIERWKSEEHVM